MPRQTHAHLTFSRSPPQLPAGGLQDGVYTLTAVAHMPVLQDCMAHPGPVSTEVTEAIPHYCPFVHPSDHTAQVSRAPFFPAMAVHTHVYYNNLPTDGSLEP